eukprot:g470.t1
MRRIRSAARWNCTSSYAEPIDIGQADTASRPSKANAHPAPDLGDAEAVPAEQLPPYFYPHLQSLAGRVFLHYATGDCTAPGGATLSTTRFRCFLRDCSILSSSESAEALQRQPSNPNNLDRRPAPGLVVGSRPAAVRAPGRLVTDYHDLFGVMKNREPS